MKDKCALQAAFILSLLLLVVFHKEAKVFLSFLDSDEVISSLITSCVAIFAVFKASSLTQSIGEKSEDRKRLANTFVFESILTVNFAKCRVTLGFLKKIEQELVVLKKGSAIKAALFYDYARFADEVVDLPYLDEIVISSSSLRIAKDIYYANTASSITQKHARECDRIKDFFSQTHKSELKNIAETNTTIITGNIDSQILQQYISNVQHYKKAHLNYMASLKNLAAEVSASFDGLPKSLLKYQKDIYECQKELREVYDFKVVV